MCRRWKNQDLSLGNQAVHSLEINILIQVVYHSCDENECFNHSTEFPPPLFLLYITNLLIITCFGLCNLKLNTGQNTSALDRMQYDIFQSKQFFFSCALLIGNCLGKINFLEHLEIGMHLLTYCKTLYFSGHLI